MRTFRLRNKGPYNGNRMAALAEGPRSGGSQGERIDWLEGARCDPEKEGSSMSRSTRAWIACALIFLGVGVAILSPIGPNLRFDYHTRSCDCVVVRDAETYCRLNLEDSRKIRHLIRFGSRPILPSEPYAPGRVAYFFDSNDDCVYCCLLLPSVSSDAQFDAVASQGALMTERTFGQVFHFDGNYPRVWREWCTPQPWKGDFPPTDR